MTATDVLFLEKFSESMRRIAHTLDMAEVPINIQTTVNQLKKNINPIRVYRFWNN